MLGIEDGDLGTHLCRKGVALIAASCCTFSPPIASMCVRTYWVMGWFKDSYIQRESDSKQYVGRCATGLDHLNKLFDISPLTSTLVVLKKK